MKHVTYLAAVVAISAAVTVSAETFAADAYVEGQLGYSSIKDVDTQAYSGTVSGWTYTNLQGAIDYDSALTYGVEAGVTDIGVKNVRLGLGIKQLKAKMNAIAINGTLTDGVTTWTGPVTATRAELATSAFDNRVRLYTANAYYDFKNTSAFTPFVGAGVGLANIENAKDNEWALDLSAGLNYDITDKVYVGLKGDYLRVAGPTDKIGIKYDAIQVMAAAATVGYRF